MSKNFEDFTRAWNDEKTLVYPANPEAAGERWFLRTPINPAMKQNLVFVGINPSDATRFATNSQSAGGDPTTEKILQFFPLNALGTPKSYRQMTIINLIPLIGQSEKSKSRSSKKLPSWKDPAGKHQIRESYGITEKVIGTVAPDSHIVHLMWGTPSSKFPWKPDALPFVKSWLCYAIDTQQVQAFLGTNGDPLHPGFGGREHWRDKTLDTNVRSLLKNK